MVKLNLTKREREYNLIDKKCQGERMKKLLLLFLIVGFAFSFGLLDNNHKNEYRYEGFSGTRYKYDLSNPLDRMEYQMDLDAQMQDKINPNPGIQMDRSFGQFGGGAEW
jgi:hypothetical protein